GWPAMSLFPDAAVLKCNSDNHRGLASEAARAIRGVDGRLTDLSAGRRMLHLERLPGRTPPSRPIKSVASCPCKRCSFLFLEPSDTEQDKGTRAFVNWEGAHGESTVPATA